MCLNSLPTFSKLYCLSKLHSLLLYCFFICNMGIIITNNQYAMVKMIQLIHVNHFEPVPSISQLGCNIE